MSQRSGESARCPIQQPQRSRSRQGALPLLVEGIRLGGSDHRYCYTRLSISSAAGLGYLVEARLRSLPDAKTCVASVAPRKHCDERLAEDPS